MRASRSEYGGFLVMAIVLVTILTLLGLIVMQTVVVDTESAGVERGGETALYIAEAGARRGIAQLENEFGMGGGASVVEMLGNVRAASPTPVAEGDPDCMNTVPCPVAGWYKLPVPEDATAENDPMSTPNIPSTRYPNPPLVREGWFRVYLGDDEYDEDTPNANQVVLLRAVGRSESGAKRVLEVAIGELP